MHKYCEYTYPNVNINMQLNVKNHDMRIKLQLWLPTVIFPLFKKIYFTSLKNFVGGGGGGEDWTTWKQNKIGVVVIGYPGLKHSFSSAVTEIIYGVSTPTTFL